MYCADAFNRLTMRLNSNLLLKLATLGVTGLIMLLLCSSCNKYALYQTNATQTSKGSSSEVIEKTLQPGDKISLSVWGHDELSVGSVHSVYSNTEESGKWLQVDENGNVNLPQIGKVKLEGMTMPKAEEKLVELYSQYIQKPILNLRLLSNQVTVLGEVRTPGSYVFHTDQVRLVDMIGKANGFTDYAKTTDIKIIRGIETINVDLTKAANNEVMVTARDVIYVAPGRNKSFDRVASKLIPLASLLTALALVYNVSVSK
jgi:polysaccharide biosynthesis/export protein